MGPSNAGQVERTVRDQAGNHVRAEARRDQQQASMTKRIWLRNYPAGLPAEIDPDRFSSIPDLLEHATAKFAARPAFHNLGCTMTYATLDQRSRDFAAFLQKLPGMGKGERVAIMAPNVLQYPVALFGVLRAGMIVVNVNPLYTPRELEHQLNDSGAKAIVIVENFASVLQQVLRNTAVQHVVTTELGDLLPVPKRWIVNALVKYVKKMVPAWHIDGAIGFNAALARGAATDLEPIALERDDIALLQYTGGTTGVSKGAMLTHRNVLANTEQTSAWVAASFEEGNEIAMAPLPLYHIFCLDGDALVHEVGRAQRAHHQSARSARDGEGARTLEMERDDGREYALQRPVAHAGIRAARLFVAEGSHRRRGRGAEDRRGTLAADHRMLHHGGLRPHRGVAGCVRQPCGRAMEWDDRRALSFHGPVDPRRRLQRAHTMGRRRRPGQGTPGRSACADRR